MARWKGNDDLYCIARAVAFFCNKSEISVIFILQPFFNNLHTRLYLLEPARLSPREGYSFPHRS